jgi:hypothetical protein
MQTKRATERRGKGLLGMTLKTYKIVLKTKQNVIIYNSCIPHQR